MKKELKDYLHLYLGCECRIADYDTRYWVRMVNETGLSVCTYVNSKGILIWWKTKDCKIILRPLESMTEDDSYELEMLGHQLVLSKVSTNEFHAARTIWFLKNHFDIFGLIEAGLAIDKTTL